MTTLNEVKAALIERVQTLWTLTDQPTTTTFENESFDPPPDGVWVRFSVVGMPSGVHTMGSEGHKRVQNRAMILAEVYGPLLQRTKGTDDACQEVARLFRLKSFAGLDCLASSVATVGKTDDERYYQVNVTVPFMYYEIC